MEGGVRVSREEAAACLAQALRYAGYAVESARLEGDLPADRVDIDELAEVARRHAALTRLVPLGPRDFGHLPPGTVVESDQGLAVVERSGPRRVALRRGDGQRFEVHRRSAATLRRALIVHRFETSAVGSTLGYVCRSFFGDWRLSARVIAVSLLMQVLITSLSFMTGVLVDAVLPTGDRNLLNMLWIAALSLAFLYFVGFIARHRLVDMLRVQSNARLSLAFVSHMVKLPLRWISQWPTADLTMRLKTHSDIIDIGYQIAGGALDIIVAFTTIVTLLVLSPKLALLTGMLAALQFVAAMHGARERKRHWAQTVAARRRCAVLEQDLIMGFETFRVQGGEGALFEHWSHAAVAHLNHTLARCHYDARTEALVGTLRILAPVIVLLVGMSWVLDGRSGLGVMLAQAAIANNFFSPINRLYGVNLNLQRLIPNVDRVRDVLRVPPEESRAGGKLVHLRGAVSLERASFSFGAGTVLHDVSLEVRPGEFLAIVGGTGSGKSTLLRLILGLLQPSSGRVCVDGQDITDVAGALLRREIGCVLQHPSFFRMTIAENLTLGLTRVDQSDIEEAARLAGIHDFVVSLPEGYATVMNTEPGRSTFSGGQMQRLAVARALVRRPKILILDEASSALDTVSEAHLRSTLRRLDCTKIVVAHRLSSIQDADRVAVLEDGRITELGRPLDLLAAGGRYARLMDAQKRQPVLENPGAVAIS
jgi:ATP-binding cassette, subfamily B, bacterial